MSLANCLSTIFYQCHWVITVLLASFYAILTVSYSIKLMSFVQFRDLVYSLLVHPSSCLCFHAHVHLGMICTSAVYFF